MKKSQFQVQNPLRRMADMERNISILATKLTTTDGDATDGDDNPGLETFKQRTQQKGHQGIKR